MLYPSNTYVITPVSVHFSTFSVSLSSPIGLLGFRPREQIVKPGGDGAADIVSASPINIIRQAGINGVNSLFSLE